MNAIMKCLFLVSALSIAEMLLTSCSKNEQADSSVATETMEQITAKYSMSAL